jgi:hypothetical protein
MGIPNYFIWIENLSILLAWQAKGVLVIPLRLLLAVPVAVVLFATNAPLALVGAMWDFREYIPNGHCSCRHPR